MSSVTTNVRDTSLLAYFSEVTPTLGDRHVCVVQCLRSLGVASNMELSQVLGWSVNRVTPRVNELRKQGVIVYHSHRCCQVTGRMVMTWTLQKNFEVKYGSE